MFTGAIAVLLAIVVLPVAAKDGDWGTFWIVLAVIGLVLLLGSVSREQDRAYNNFVRHWADGGPDRRRRR